MAGLSGKRGKELLVEVVNHLRTIDPKIILHDSQEVEDLELSVIQAVRDVFGSGSSEYDEFEKFKISAGPISRSDSKTEKQSKYEMGMPRSRTRLEELLDLMDRVAQPPGEIQELTSDDLVEIDPLPLEEPVKSKDKTKSTQPKPAAKPTAKPAPKPADKPKAEKTPAMPRPSKTRAAEKSAPGAKQPGKVLIISGTEEVVTQSVDSLLGRLGIATEAPGVDPAALTMENLASVDHIAFTLMILTGSQKGGLSGLTSAIGLGRSNHELTFKLGFFVGRLGPGATAVLYEGDRPVNLPEQLFGVRYIQYQEEGGWQIDLLKLLKANGFFIDANLLFE